METVGKFLAKIWICTGSCGILSVLLKNYILALPTIYFIQGTFWFFNAKEKKTRHKFSSYDFTDHFNFSCLEGNCTAPEACFKQRTSGTIFQCPASNLFSNDDMVTYEEWVVEDIAASGFEDPMQHDLQPLILYGAPPPKVYLMPQFISQFLYHL